ncbi:NAD(P)-dependent oxidoreductase [Haloferula sp. BvORR071]|uniref:SDR family oxidoreductase n=1 Tax=Haloferula sp. BvORR071 TaxID=1396141 RepID=UPI0006965D21|nr:NAD(P)-dependent oxidoreductase [Haloferula sp. BvORR071]
MRLAITGTTGRVGQALATHLRDRHELIELPRSLFDLAGPDLPAKLAELDFDMLLNPAGLTGLEHCEDDPALAERVNAAAPAEMADFCRREGKRLLHFSTDYVFDGLEPGLKGEDSPVAPLSVYGRTKAAGERAVLDAGGTVMRVSWVFGPEKPAFPDTVIDRALAGQEVAAVADKFSRPALTTDIAEWVGTVLEAGCPPGIFHACNGGPITSWHGMAEEIIACLRARTGLELPAPKPLLLAEMAVFRAVRPRHTAMAITRLSALLGHEPRDWREALREHVESRLISR